MVAYPVIRHAASAFLVLRLRVLHLMLYLSPCFVISGGRNALHFPAFQKKYTDNRRNNDCADVEPEIVFFLFHFFTSTDFYRFSMSAANWLSGVRLGRNSGYVRECRSDASHPTRNYSMNVNNVVQALVIDFFYPDW